MIRVIIINKINKVLLGKITLRLSHINLFLIISSLHFCCYKNILLNF
nr:MAG TPA: hypothetical protein [Caudoviricetes sp.]